MTHNAGMTVWFTGLSCSGKSTLSGAVYALLEARGFRVELLDGDTVRQSLTRDLSFSKADRDENVRRISWVAELLTRHGVIALVSAIAPYRAAREAARKHIGEFVEVYVNAPLDVCEARDLKGLYRRARAGEIASFTGVSDPYEPPLDPEVKCNTDVESVEESAAKVLEAILAKLDSRNA